MPKDKDGNELKEGALVCVNGSKGVYLGPSKYAGMYAVEINNNVANVGPSITQLYDEAKCNATAAELKAEREEAAAAFKAANAEAALAAKQKAYNKEAAALARKEAVRGEQYNNDGQGGGRHRRKTRKTKVTTKKAAKKTCYPGYEVYNFRKNSRGVFYNCLPKKRKTRRRKA